MTLLGSIVWLVFGNIWSAIGYFIGGFLSRCSTSSSSRSAFFHLAETSNSIA